MEVRHELARDGDRPLVLAVGFFDGFHRGHREIARQTFRLRKPGWRCGLVTFANHPSAHLRPGTEPELLCTPQERLALIARAGFEECFFVTFDDEIATLSPGAFLRVSWSSVSACAAWSSAEPFGSATSVRATSI